MGNGNGFAFLFPADPEYVKPDAGATRRPPQGGPRPVKGVDSQFAISPLAAAGGTAGRHIAGADLSFVVPKGTTRAMIQIGHVEAFRGVRDDLAGVRVGAETRPIEAQSAGALVEGQTLTISPLWEMPDREVKDSALRSLVSVVWLG